MHGSFLGMLDFFPRGSILNTRQRRGGEEEEDEWGDGLDLAKRRLRENRG